MHIVLNPNKLFLSNKTQKLQWIQMWEIMNFENGEFESFIWGKKFSKFLYFNFQNGHIKIHQMLLLQKTHKSLRSIEILGSSEKAQPNQN